MADGDRERWNARWQAEGPPPGPAPWLATLGGLLPRRGRALDVAGGSGRNALWLCRRGLDVTLADVSDVALEQAARSARAAGLTLATARVDLEAAPVPAGPFGVILCLNFLYRPIFPRLAEALAGGGLLVVSHVTRTNLSRHDHPGPRWVLEDGELPTLVAGLEVLRSEEGWMESGRHEARLVARRKKALEQMG
jgi:tellurite methyltransferase